MTYRLFLFQPSQFTCNIPLYSQTLFFQTDALPALITMICPLRIFLSFSLSWKSRLAIFLIILPATNTYGFTIPVAFEQYSSQGIPTKSKVDLTKLPHGEVFKIQHSKFSLQFFKNNRDIFGFVFTRKPNYGIVAHLCFFRSCEESKYDLRKFIVLPQAPPSDRTFFSIKFPHRLNYEFQGMEFLAIK